MQRVLQGQINMLEFMMVDATDAFTPESALSAAMNIKIYGTLIGNSNVFFVTSGVGSLAASNRDVVHIGASATGLYAVPLGTAQLSDASNVFYDHYCVIITATGAAQQTLILSGVRTSLSNILSTMGSQFAVTSNYLSQISALLSDVDSALTSQFTYTSLILSDLNSRIDSTVPSRSQLSDLASDIKSAVAAGGSGATTSAIAAKVWSDFASQVGRTLSDTFSEIFALSDAISDLQSDLRSLMTSASWMSDLASHVWTAKYTGLSGPSSFGSLLSDLSSRAIAHQTYASAVLSDLNSRVDSTVPSRSQLSDLISDLRSYVAGRSQLSGLHSDLDSTIVSQFSHLLSLLGATGVTLTSDMQSNLRSAITAAGGGGATPSALWAYGYVNLTGASTIGSALRTRLSTISGVYSGISNLQSRVDSTVASRSQLSDLISDLRSLMTSASWMSDLASHVWTAKYTGLSGPSSFGSLLSDISSRAIAQFTYMSLILSDLNSRVDSTVPSRSQLSDLISDLRSYVAGRSQLSGLHSDLDSTIVSQFSHLLSLLGTTGVMLTSDLESNLRSAITAAGGGATPSAIAAKVWSDFESRVGSTVSDIYSTLAAGGGGATTSAIAAKVWSDFQSQVGRTVSDTFSELLALSDGVSGITSLLSDLRSVLTVTGVGLNPAHATVSDLVSKVSDLRSKVLVISDVLSDFYSDFQSRVPKAVATNSQLSDLHSDLKSQLTATAAVTSDILSTLGSQFAVTSNYLSNLSAMVSDVDSALTSQFTYTSGALSDLTSRITAPILTRAQTMSELSVGTPPVNPTQEQALMALYAGIVNQFKTTASQKQWKKSDGSTIFEKSIAASGNSYVEQAAAAP